MKTRYLWLPVALGLAAFASAGCAPAPTGPDVTPPDLEVLPRAMFVVGSQITTADPYENYEGLATGPTNGIGALLSWSARDSGSGICGYDLRREYAGAGDETIPLVVGTLDTAYVDYETDYDDQQGGGSGKILGWYVEAHDCAGNSATKRIGGVPIVVQESGRTFFYGDWPPTYTGTWESVACECWSDGAAARTTEPGATATFTLGPYDDRVALVMTEGPGRGQFRVLVDGVERAVVDTFGAAQRDRVVVWEGPASANSVVQVVNLATPYRPRIDLDAIMIR